jgi:hypothetical protein
MTVKQWALCLAEQKILNTNEFTALYDKGYHTGSELKLQMI